MSTVIVGGGITGSLISFMLKARCNSLILDVWELERNIGGRMSTIRSEDHFADIGAQYVTTDERTLKSKAVVYDPLLSNQILKPLTCPIVNRKSSPEHIRHFVAPRGTASLVEYFMAAASPRNIRTSHTVTAIKVRGDMVEVTSDDRTERFDHVIITVPVPEFLTMDINFEIKASLLSVQYSSRYVLVLCYSEQLDTDWAAQYIDNKIFRYVSIQEAKVNQPGNSSVIFHTSVQFGEANDQRPKSEVQSMLVEEARILFPQWPKPDNIYCHYWRYSQAVESLNCGCVIVSERPLIVLAGDGLTRSNFDGCIESAESAVDAILDHFKKATTFLTK